MTNPGSNNYEEKTLCTPSQIAGIAAILRSQAQRNDAFHSNVLVQSNETSNVDTHASTSSPSTSINLLQGELTKEEALALALRNSMNAAETRTVATSSVTSDLQSCSNPSETNQTFDSSADNSPVLIPSQEVPLDLIQGELSEDEALCAIALQNSCDDIEPNVDVMASFNSNILSDQLSALTVDERLYEEEDEALARALQISVVDTETRDDPEENVLVSILSDHSLSPSSENISSSRGILNDLNTVQESLTDDEALAIALQISEEDSEPSLPNSEETSMPEIEGKESTLQTSLECNICLEPPKNAVVSLCGHLFCKNCLFRWLDITSVKSCPVCKTPICKKKVIRLYGTGQSEEKTKSENKTNVPAPSPTNRPSSLQIIESTRNANSNVQINLPVPVTGLVSRPEVTIVKFNPPTGFDTMMRGGGYTSVAIRYQCITFMNEYNNKSFEELRLQDYSDGRRNGCHNHTSRVVAVGRNTLGQSNRTTLLIRPMFRFNSPTSVAPRQSFPKVSTQNQPLFGTTGILRPTLSPGPVLEKFVPLIGTDIVNGASINTKHQSITCMTAYKNMSFEELRLNDYSCGRKGIINLVSPGQTAKGLLGGLISKPPRWPWWYTNITNFGAIAFNGGTLTKFMPTTGVEENVDEENVNDGCSNVTYQCITFMKEYGKKSFEELRLEDYICGRKGRALTAFC